MSGSVGCIWFRRVRCVGNSANLRRGGCAVASRGVRGERKSLAQNRHAEQEARVMVAVCRSEYSGNHVAEIRVEPLERETSALGVVELDSLLWVLEWTCTSCLPWNRDHSRTSTGIG